jgi:amino acid adenylation domain-containing protein
MSVTDETTPQLADARRALLEKRRKGRMGSTSEQPIARRPADVPAPASFGQERLWFVQQLQPASSAYHMTSAVRLRGALDAAQLRTALQYVIQRHEALRTTLTLHDGRLVQQIAPSLGLDLPEETVAAGQVETRLRAFAAMPFDLEQGPLVRAVLLREAPEVVVLAVVMHHIISDEWSMGVFWRDLSAAYHAASSGAQPVLPPLTVHYADVAWEQREHGTRDTQSGQLEYWLEQLGGELPLLQLPADHPRPPVQRYEGAFIRRVLSAELSERILVLSRAQGATPFAVLLAAFQVLLHRFAHQDDILIGTPVTNRADAQTDGVIGFFLNTAVLRADFSQSRGFDELLAATRQQALAALANQRVSFEQMVEALRPRRDPSYNPLFQAMFVFQDAGNLPQLPGIDAEALVIDAGVSKFDVTLFAGLAAGQFTLSLEYSTALFERPTAERLLRSFEVLLGSLIDDPGRSVEQLDILPPEERKLLLDEWAATVQTPVPEICIHDIISAQPHAAPAVVFGDQTLSYGELDACANQVAHHLHALGVAPGEAVGLCVERSLDMAIGIVGILKAGCAYVPIDPAYPVERVQYILDDAGIGVLLTQHALLARLPRCDVRLVSLNDPAIDRQPREAPQPRATPDDLAYMIYTSGSTGRPKGVRVSHRNLVHSTVARFVFYPEPARSFLLLSSFAFDSSLVGIFWTLCQGGVLCLPPPQAEHDVMQLAGLIGRHNVTHTLMLPSLYRVLLDFAGAEQLRSLRTVIVAGEACPLALAAQHHALLPQATLYNEYGPTEGTVWATAWQIPARPERILIGRAIPNMQTYILDRRGEPVPIGVAGELYIGGAGITAGYHNRPELTAERFVPNPFGAGRLYRTGDLARYLDNGEIEFLGRLDTQVKLNGYRLELGEIENVLLRHPQVNEATVLLVEGQRAAIELAPAELLRLLEARPDAERLLADIEALGDEEAVALIGMVGM